MRKIYNPTKETWSTLLKRPTVAIEDIEMTVNEIFKEVKIKGDLALTKYTSLFDGIQLDSLTVSDADIKTSEKSVSKDVVEAIKIAKANIEKFHKAQKTDTIEIETTKGVKCWQEKRPIQKVGIYIPGGTAPLFSTVLM
jgi:histidinol dehydrogenase